MALENIELAAERHAGTEPHEGGHVNKALLRFLAMLFAFAMIVAACGDSDDESAEETAAPAETSAPAETTEAPEATEAPDTTEAAETTEAPDTTAAGEFEEITLLVVNNMAHLPVFYAQELGLWAERGLDVKVETLGSGADIAAGLESGQAEFGAVNGGTGVAPQRASGLLTKLVAPYNNDALNAKYVDWIGIIGRADSGLTTDPQSVTDCNGATCKVGVTGGGTPRAYLREWLTLNGLSEDDLEIVTMGAPDMLTAILNGDVDFVVPWDPFRQAAFDRLADNAVEISAGESLVTSSIGLGAVDGQLETNPDLFKRFIEGVVEAAYLIRLDPEAAAPVVVGFTNVSEDEAIRAMARNVYDPRVSVCTEYGVEITAQKLVDQGSIEVETPFTSADLIDASILNEVLAEHPEWLEDLPPVPDDASECVGYEG